MSRIGAHETVARIAAYCRAEQLVFALLGDGASRLLAPAAKPVALAAADHAAWRARRWYELLPTAPPGADAFLVATDADVEVTEGSRDHSTDSATALAVVALELLPRLRSAMEDHLDRADAVADSAVRRILGIACTDLATDLEALLGVLEASLGDESSRDRAAAASGAVAAIVARTHWPVPAA